MGEAAFRLAMTLLLGVPVVVVFPLQVHYKLQGEIGWSWHAVFWPYWALFALCAALAAAAACRGGGGGGGGKAAALRNYNLGLLCVLSLPLAGAGWLEGQLSDQLGVLLPALGLAAAAGLCCMHRARPCSGRKARREAD